MTANVKYTAEQRRLMKLTLPIGWVWFTLLAVQTDSLGSKVTHANTPTALSRFKNVIFRHHYVMQKNSGCIETKQPYLCRVLHFSRQNL